MTEKPEVRSFSRRSFLKLGCGALLGGTATCALGSLYATRIEPHWIEVVKQDIGISSLAKTLDGFTIVQLSDFHVGPYVSAEDVRQSVEIANALMPDLIALTGDFVYRSARYSIECARELASLRAKHGVYAVLGNHDIWTGATQVASKIEGVGISVLRDMRHALEIGDTRLWLLGIEDTGHTGGYFSDFKVIWQGAANALENLLEGIPADEPRILLVHNPDFTEMLPEGRVDLALCGHTHGGQVRLPFIGAPIVPSCFGQKYASGLVRGPSILVYINRGIGLIAPPVRLNCRPEITLFRLRKE